MNRAWRPRPSARRLAISTSNPTTRVGSPGSASTNGEPPSASPPQRSSFGACPRTDWDKPTTAIKKAAATFPFMLAVFCTNGRARTIARRISARTLAPSHPRTHPRTAASSHLRTVEYSSSMREWNANSYHQVSTPQFDWGTAVLERLPLAGDELVLDVGCGTGRLTEKLLERLPHGHVVGIDVSRNMLQVAHEFLRPRFGPRIQLVLADASDLPVSGAADAVFSTATFHWVRDHPRLFRGLYRALKPGGRVVAQCGGGPNIARLHDRAAVLMHEPPFAAHFTTWQEPWEFADAATAARRLEETGL